MRIQHRGFIRDKTESPMNAIHEYFPFVVHFREVGNDRNFCGLTFATKIKTP